MMPAPVSIRERIVRQIAAELAPFVSGSVIRWHDRGDLAFRDGDVLLAEDAESGTEGAIGVPGTTTKTLRVWIMPVIRAADETGASVGSVASSLIATIQFALSRNWQLREQTTGIRLAVEMRTYEAEAPDWAEGEAGVALLVEAVYDHDRDNPYQYGAAIPPLHE